MCLSGSAPRAIVSMVLLVALATGCRNESGPTAPVEKLGASRVFRIVIDGRGYGKYGSTVTIAPANLDVTRGDDIDFVIQTSSISCGFYFYGQGRFPPSASGPVRNATVRRNIYYPSRGPGGNILQYAVTCDGGARADGRIIVW